MSSRPEKFNLWFASKGTYQTEFFLNYWWPAHLGLKAGLALYHSVYVTDQALNFDNQRFRNMSAFFTLGLQVRW